LERKLGELSIEPPDNEKPAIRTKIKTLFGSLKTPDEKTLKVGFQYKNNSLGTIYPSFKGSA